MKLMNNEEIVEVLNKIKLLLELEQDFKDHVHRDLAEELLDDLIIELT
jgi:hypothetical protein